MKPPKNMLQFSDIVKDYECRCSVLAWARYHGLRKLFTKNKIIVGERTCRKDCAWALFISRENLALLAYRLDKHVAKKPLGVAHLLKETAKILRKELSK